MGPSGHRKLHGSLGRPSEAAGHLPCPKEKWALAQRDGPDTNGIFPGHLSLSYPLSHSPLPVLLSPDASGLHKVHLFHRNRSRV